MTPRITLALLPVLAGAIFAIRVMRLRHPLYYLPLGAGIGWTVALMLADLLLKAGLAFDTGLYLTFGLLGAAGLAGLPGVAKVPKVEIPVTRPGWFYLLAGSAVVWFTSVTILLLNPDGDYWIHAPMQGQILLGNFPPTNPYFTDIKYGGHYARDFLGVLASWCTGTSPFAMQIPVAALLQLGAFFTLFIAGCRFGGGQLAGALLSLYVFTGVNAGLRQGWLDTLANNTSLANLHTSLLLFLIIRALFEEVSWAEVGVTGVLFAGLAWSYETNFVSLSLGLVTLALITAAKRKLTLHQLKVTAALVGVALVILIVQGGSIGHLITSKLPGQSAPTEQLDERMQAQNQKVTIKFPKEKLLQINVVRPGEDLSIAYLTVPWAKKLGLEFEELGYVSILTPKVWRIHWLAFYLSPFAFVFLWRRFNPLGLAFFSYGFASFMLPALVDFGIFEVEVFRWQFATSWGFAGALGVAFGLWYTAEESPLFKKRDGFLVMGRKSAILLTILVVSYFNSYPCWSQIERRTSLLPNAKSGWDLPTSKEWLFFHPILGMNEADLEIMSWLFEKAQPGDKFLTNFRERNYDNMMEENTLIGLSGVHPTGHSLPLKYEPVGTPPFRRNAFARAYWASGDEQILRNRPPRWLYHRSDSPGIVPTESAQLKLVKEASSAVGGGALYETALEPFPTLLQSELPSTLSVEVEPSTFLPEQHHKLNLKVRNESPQQVSGARLLTYEFVDEPNEEGLSQQLELEILPGEVQQLPMHFVTPHHAGEYRVRLHLEEDGDLKVLGDFPIVVESGFQLQNLEVSWSKGNPALRQGALTEVKLEVRNSSDEEIRFEGLASLTFDVGERPPTPDDFQPLRFELAPGETKQLDLMVLNPIESGAWPVNLKLGSRLGVMSFKLGELAVNPP